MNKKRKVTAALLAVLAVVILLLAFGLERYLSMRNSIAIIGGADGPTSVFVAGKISPRVPVGMAAAGIAAAGAAVWLWKRRNK